MAIEFNAYEIFEIAEQIERNGAGFYRRAAETVEDSQKRRILLDLASQEDEHEKTFAAMRAELTEEERRPTVFDPDGEASLYLKDLARGKVFDVRIDPAQFLTGKEKMEDILHTAIGLEKDSIIFYQGMKDAVPARLGGARIDAIIKEEMKHIATLKQQLSSLTG